MTITGEQSVYGLACDKGLFILKYKHNSHFLSERIMDIFNKLCRSNQKLS
jgi:hypothetical protein